jgi:hypothetical protein
MNGCGVMRGTTPTHSLCLIFIHSPLRAKGYYNIRTFLRSNHEGNLYILCAAFGVGKKVGWFLVMEDDAGTRNTT